MKLTDGNENTLLLTITDDDSPYLDRHFIDALADCVEQINVRENIHCVIVEGNKKYFSAGASRDSLVCNDTLPQYVRKVPELFLSINVPTIAAMEGHAIGGGLILGLWSDVAIMAEESLYGANFMALGFTPGMGATTVMEDIFGEFFAREMLFTGRLIKGREFQSILNQSSLTIVPKMDVYSRALQIARELAEIPRVSLMLLKETFANRRLKKLREVLDEEEAMHTQLFADPKTRAAINSRYQQAINDKDKN